MVVLVEVEVVVEVVVARVVEQGDACEETCAVIN